MNLARPLVAALGALAAAGAGTAVSGMQPKWSVATLVPR
jgi:hypothetical protein